MQPRIVEELSLLRGAYADVQHKEAGGQDWFLLPTYLFPDGWLLGATPIIRAPICFPINVGYPGAQPYSFSTPAGITFRGQPPVNAKETQAPPFDGQWCEFSWQPEEWKPTGDVRKGSNLLIWARGFAARLREGV